MFVGAINSTIRKFLANSAHVFDGANVVIGCSGNFTSEAVVTHFSMPSAIHSNDVSFYSCMLGRWLTGQALEFEIVDSDYSWLGPFLETDDHRMAAICVLLDMLEHDRRNNAHRRRMWESYRQGFNTLMVDTLERLGSVRISVTSFYAGDVFDHFLRFEDDPAAIFCSYAPTYAGGYERLYKRLDEIIRWDTPAYSLLDDERRGALLDWMSERRFLWYDDRLLPGREPVLLQRRGRMRTVYLYSNVVETPALFAGIDKGPLPDLPLADSSLEITESSVVNLLPIKTSELSRFKDAFLGKNIDHASGLWALAVCIDGVVVGFLEFKQARYQVDAIYLMADFAVPGTRYRRLSKLVVMLGLSADTRRWLERVTVMKKRTVCTTAFTDRPVSMKYRGVMELQKRGQTDTGQKFLNYGANFTEDTWQEVLSKWLTKHGSIR